MIICHVWWRINEYLFNICQTRKDNYMSAHQLLFRRQRRMNCKKYMRLSNEIFYKEIRLLYGAHPLRKNFTSICVLKALFKYQIGVPIHHHGDPWMYQNILIDTPCAVQYIVYSVLIISWKENSQWTWTMMRLETGEGTWKRINDSEWNICYIYYPASALSALGLLL